MRRIRRFAELCVRLMLAKTKEDKATVRRSVAARYRVRKPKTDPFYKNVKSITHFD